MNAVADRFKDKGVGSIFLYTHEAHPGENYLHHTSMDMKFKHACDLRDVLGVTRPILVDSLDGAAHRAYGSMPNMSWIFTRAGKPVYKGDWSDSRSIETAVEYFVGMSESRRQGRRFAPFRVERLDMRTQNHEGFQRGLERNGPKAVREFSEAF